MGPFCPKCGYRVEWTEGEITEKIFTPKVYICSECYEIYTVSVEALECLQLQANKFLTSVDEAQTESPEDWAKLREEWDQRL